MKEDLCFVDEFPEIAVGKETGRIWATCDRGKKVKAGQELKGYPNSHGYLTLKINRKHWKVHRLVFLAVHGYLPEQVDHINGDRKDNRSINLRASTNALNGKNQHKYSNNRSGITGVCWDERSEKHRAHIRINGKTKHLGSFSDINDAADARKKAQIEYGFWDLHGIPQHERQMLKPTAQQLEEFEEANKSPDLKARIDELMRKEVRSNNASGGTGVVWDKRRKKWRAQIKINGKSKHLGYFREKIEAAEARQRAEDLLGRDGEL